MYFLNASKEIKIRSRCECFNLAGGMSEKEKKTSVKEKNHKKNRTTYEYNVYI